ncbi:hypothetical protein CQ013_18050 [Arthrobacter sp. MYb216]|uniref:hypothetical protein n=1 Tax=unclassified Arthrobacter TaxID=235627 RepID=UPI000CFDC3FD|nr:MULTISPECIES: hypothetical protein [unclassified Arthrobacter]PRB46392.1 hypothetical protein CQ013_18050 [Arthrobacter sp. MYb216]
MIISQDVESNSSTILDAAFGEYDGFAPTSKFIVDTVSKNSSPEYVALAAYLVFGTWTSGAIVFPESITPELASAMEEDSAPVRIRPQGINLVPKRVKLGDHGLFVNLNGGSPPADCLEVEILPFGFNEGFLRKSGHLQVSSNAFMFSGVLDRKYCYRPIIAAALLANADLHLGRIYLSADIEQQEFISLHELLQATGIELIRVS